MPTLLLQITALLYYLARFSRRFYNNNGLTIIVFIERNRSRERKFKDKAADIVIPGHENAIRHKEQDRNFRKTFTTESKKKKKKIRKTTVGRNNARLEIPN